jgi:hypothetical protein
MSPKAAARLLPQTLFMLLALCDAAGASAAGRDVALRRCREQFGPAVDAERNLFEVNRWYVLEVKFDARSRLSELNVLPRRYFAEAHPEWEEPDAPNLEGYWARHLTRYDYEKLLQRLDRVEPKGGLLKRGVSGVVTNMTSPVNDLYERAELKRGEVLDLRRGDYAPTLFRYVRLRYLAPAELNKAVRRDGRLLKGVGGREVLKLMRKGRTVDQRR